MLNGGKDCENAGNKARHSLLLKATVFYIFSADYKRILAKMGLAILKPDNHKTLFCQGEMSDAFNKSKYDIGILTYSECQNTFRNCITS